MRKLIIENTIRASLLFLTIVSAAYAQTASSNKPANVINTLSDDFQNNFTIQSTPQEQTSRKVKYIQPPTENFTLSGSLDFGNNTTAVQPQPLQQDAQEESSPPLAILKSNQPVKGEEKGGDK